MKKVSVMVADENAFFARGRRLAALADAGKPIPSESVISFGDPADLLKMLTPARLALMSAVKAQPDSITAIAERLHRDRSAVKRDVDSLHKAGLLAVGADRACRPRHDEAGEPDRPEDAASGGVGLEVKS